MTRKDILEAALKCVNGDRDEQYGNPENSFEMVAELWDTYLNNIVIGEGIKPKDVAVMLILLKIARISLGQPKYDNWIDIAGYAACGGEIDHGAKEAKQIESNLTENEKDFIRCHIGYEPDFIKLEPHHTNPEDSCRHCAACNHKD